MIEFIIKRTSSDELKHHGIKGQKKGKRRFQNEDGTLTPEGKERYGIGSRFQRIRDKIHDNHMVSLDRSAQRGKDLRERGKGTYPRTVIMGIVRQLGIEFAGVTAAKLGANVSVVNKGIIALSAINLGVTASRIRDIHNDRTYTKVENDEKRRNG